MPPIYGGGLLRWSILFMSLGALFLCAPAIAEKLGYVRHARVRYDTSVQNLKELTDMISNSDEASGELRRRMLEGYNDAWRGIEALALVAGSENACASEAIALLESIAGASSEHLKLNRGRNDPANEHQTGQPEEGR